MEKYPWYEVVDGKEQIEQGDFIDSCPIVVPTPTIKPGKVSADVMEYDIAILSQSCDLAQGKVDLVIVCPVWSLEEFGENNAFFKDKEGKEVLRRGNALGYHLLNKCEISGFENDYKVVDFRHVYGVPFDFLCELAKKGKKRLRLLPPYREHLSQAFARFFMRVGLPADIPPFK